MVLHGNEKSINYHKAFHFSILNNLLNDSQIYLFNVTQIVLKSVHIVLNEL